MTNAPARRLPAIMTARFDASAPCCDDRFSPSPNNFEQNKNRAGDGLGNVPTRRLSSLGCNVMLFGIGRGDNPVLT
jgi:hypothetical protein